jgi:hypothetical protein
MADKSRSLPYVSSWSASWYSSCFRGLHRVGRIRGQPTADAVVEGTQVLFRKGVVETQHGLCVLDGRKSELHAAAHASRGRVLTDQIGMLTLEAYELLHQRVELAVGDLGRVQDVVALFVVPDLAAELFDPFGGSHVADG